MNPYTLTRQCWLTSKNLQQLYADTGCSLEDLTEEMDDRDGWRERESGKSMLSVQLEDDNQDMVASIPI